jgi:hypothetical protein
MKLTRDRRAFLLPHDHEPGRQVSQLIVRLLQEIAVALQFGDVAMNPDVARPFAIGILDDRNDDLRPAGRAVLSTAQDLRRPGAARPKRNRLFRVPKFFARWKDERVDGLADRFFSGVPEEMLSALVPERHDVVEARTDD